MKQSRPPTGVEKLDVGSHPNDRRTGGPGVAILAWGDLMEDFLEPLGLTLESFIAEFNGSWMFRYTEALQAAGIRPVIVAFTSAVTTPVSAVHGPTGAAIHVLPSLRIYRLLRRWVRKPRGRSARAMFGPLPGWRRLALPLAALVQRVFLYLATDPLALARLVREQGIASILVQEYETPRFDIAVVLGRILHVPVFASFQGGSYQRSGLERFVRPITLRASSALIISSDVERRRVRARYTIPDVPIHRVFTPVNLPITPATSRGEVRRQLGIPDDVRVVVWHGRVALQQKGLDVLIQAWKQLCASRDPVRMRLLLIGSGPDSAELDRLITELSPGSVVRVDEFVHDRARVRDLLSSADVYAFPSRHEGFPVALIEALLCGLPVVAADADGVPDILGQGRASAGYMVSRDDAAALAARLGALVDDPELAARLGANAADWARSSFSPPEIGIRLSRLLLPPEARLSPVPVPSVRVGGGVGAPRPVGIGAPR
jgi:glycosyltransferase involved in cell wall biosynthesis